MIDWLVSQLNENPGRSFYEAEIVESMGLDGLDELRRKSLIEPLTDLGDGDYFDWQTGGRMLTLIQGPFGLEAFDLEDPEFVPRLVSASDLRQWQASPPGIVETFRQTNQLSGPTEVLSLNAWLLGELMLEKGLAGCVLVLAGNHDPHNLLAAVPAQLGNKYGSILVVTYSHLSPSQQLRLSQLGVELARTDPSDPLTLLGITLAGGLIRDHGLLHNDDYSSVIWRGQTLTLLPSEAPIIQRLHQASKTANPDVLDTTLVRLVDTSEVAAARELRDILRRSQTWQTLVVSGARRGYYRLNLP